MAIVTSQDCIDTGLTFAGELANHTGDAQASEFRASALDYLNRAYLAILSASNEFDLDLGEPFTWAKAQNSGVLTFLPSIAISCTVTTGSTSVTLAAIPTDDLGNQVSLAGRYLKMGGSADMYIVSAHTSGTTSLTLDQGYTDTSATGLATTAYCLDYNTVSGVLRLIAPMRIYKYQGNPSVMGSQSGGEIMGSDLAAMLRDYPLYALATYVPTRFATKYLDTTTNTFTLRINSSVATRTRAEYDYIPQPTTLTDAASSVPIIPSQHRIVLAYAVAYFLCLDKYDDRAGEYLSKLQAGLRSMKKADEDTRQNVNPFRARLIPRRDLTKRYRFWSGY